MLTGTQLSSSGMITNFEMDNIQQQGIDVRIKSVSKLKGKVGVVPKVGKTILPEFENIEPLHYRNGDQRIYGWMLGPGVYDIVFMEGVNIDKEHCMKPMARSSLIRMGAHIHSGLYDAGFHTENAGAMLYVDSSVLIEVGARVAQLVCFESDEVTNLYDGQWQNDQQREAK